MVLATACGPSDESLAPSVNASQGIVGGSIAAIADAPVGAYAEVEAVSLVDATVTAAGTARAATYELSVPPGPHLFVFRIENPAEGTSDLQTSGTVEVTAGSQELDVPLQVSADWQRIATALATRSQAGGGPVVGIGRIPMSGPPGLGLGDNAAGSIITGLVDPCQKAGGKVVDLDDEVKEAMDREQQLSDDGRLDTIIDVQPIPPDVVIQGKVTVGTDGKPVVDLTVTDADTGEPIRHIVIDGEPEDGANIAPFLRRVGTGAPRRDMHQATAVSDKR